MGKKSWVPGLFFLLGVDHIPLKCGQTILGGICKSFKNRGIIGYE
jgi:hypothetical protein